MHWWFSGRMSACHAGDPGPIPGQCIFFSISLYLHIDSYWVLFDEHEDYTYFYYNISIPKLNNFLFSIKDKKKN